MEAEQGKRGAAVSRPGASEARSALPGSIPERAILVGVDLDGRSRPNRGSAGGARSAARLQDSTDLPGSDPHSGAAASSTSSYTALSME